jgi:hypothetical protein
MKLFNWLCDSAGGLLGRLRPGRRPGGLADLSVYDRNEGRSLPVYWHEGRAWVVGKPGNEYQLNAQPPGRGAARGAVGGRRQCDHGGRHPQQSGYVVRPGARWK